MRSAQPLKSSEDIPDAKTYKLVGTQMSLVLALALEETDSMSVDISEDEVTEVETVTHKEASDSLNPTLIEDSKDGGGGYFLIGEAATAAAGGPEVNVSRSLDLVSGHNLAVAEDSAGNRPQLEVQLSLAREEAGDRVTSGRLPDSDMETEAELTETSPPIQLPDSAAAGVNIGKHGLSHAKPRTQTVTPASPPTKISRPAPTEQGVASVMSSPKKPKLSPQKLDITQDTPKSSKSPFPHDSTDYLRMPSPKVSPHKSPVRAEARAPAHYKLTVDLASVTMVRGDWDGQEGVLAYKYLALHKEAIRTDPFPITSGASLPVPKGYTQFSFCVHRDKMEATFRAHAMHVALYANSHILGVATLQLAEVLGASQWQGKLSILEKQTGDLVGFLEVELQLAEEADTPTKLVQTKHDELMATKDLLNTAANELETWKMDQKKKFNENLLQIEQQHLNLLGQEWKERELQREREMQEKLAVMKGLEDELRKELEKLEAERKEMDEKKRSLQSDRDKVDLEKRNVKNEKIAVIDKLKQQIRDKDGQLSLKSSEVELLTKRVKTLESESRRPLKSFKPNNSNKSKMDEDLLAELSQVIRIHDRIIFIN